MSLSKQNLESIDVPDILRPLVNLQNYLNNLNKLNLKEVALVIARDLEYYKKIEELVTNILIFVEIRRRDFILYSLLCIYLKNLIGEKFKKRVLEKASALFLRSLFLNNFFTLDEIKHILEKNKEMYFYFAPEVGIPEVAMLCFDSNFIEEKLDEYKKNDWKLYKEVLEYGCIVNSIEYAIKFDKVDLLKTFGDIKPGQKATTNPFVSEEEMDLLCFASLNGSENSFNYLISRGFKIDNNVARCAVRGGNRNIFVKCNKNETLVSDAIEYHRYDFFDELVKYITSTDFFNECISLGNIKCYLFFLDNGADPNVKDCYGWCSLQHAALIGQQSLVEYLISYRNVDINGTVLSDSTALHCASKYNNIAIAKILIKNGADVNFKDMSLQTPLHIAVQKSNLVIARLLVKNGADIEAEDEDSYKPIEFISKDDLMKQEEEEVFEKPEDYTDDLPSDRILNAIVPKSTGSAKANPESTCCLML